MADLKTAVFDWSIGEFALDLQNGVQTVTKGAAVAQIAMKAQQTKRGAFLIYANRDAPELHHKYGSDAQATMVKDIPEASRMSELKRNVRDALLYDPWVTDVTDVSVTRQQVTDKDTGAKTWAYVAGCTVSHVYGTTTLEGVET